MEKIKYHINEFDGPLDLLLDLIKKHKLNIDDIQVTLLIDQYLNAIKNMKKYNIDIASEFLEMSARLIYMKSVFLIPQNKEIDKLKQELTQELIHYNEYKLAAQALSQKVRFDSFVRNAEKLDIDYRYKLTHHISHLAQAYKISFKRIKSNLENINSNLSVIVSRKVVSVYSKVIYIFKLLRHIQCIEYNLIFDTNKNKSNAIATFLALLELIKNKKVYIKNQDNVLKIFLNNKRRKKYAK